MKLQFALCTDENFVIPALVSIVSIFENNMKDECVVTVLTEGVSESAMAKFDTLATKYNQKINVVRIDPSRFQNMVTRGRYPVSMYFRFLLPEILPTVGKVLYIDCDIMVRKSLAHLFSLPLDGKACGVVVDQQCDDVQIQNRLRIKSPYFNSGVMLMNLDEWRIQDYTNKIVDFIESNPSICIFPDQDALNSVLESKVDYLDYGYNLQEMWLTMLDYTRFHYSRYEELEKAKTDPAIIHFCVSEKPWYKECRNPYKEEYLKYASKHDFIGFDERCRYSRFYYRIEAEIQRLKRWQKRFVRK